MVEWLGCWICDQQVAGSNPDHPAVECAALGKLLAHICLCHHASSIIWYQPMGGDALRLGR